MFSSNLIGINITIFFLFSQNSSMVIGKRGKRSVKTQGQRE